MTCDKTHFWSKTSGLLWAEAPVIKDGMLPG